MFSFQNIKDNTSGNAKNKIIFYNEPFVIVREVKVLVIYINENPSFTLTGDHIF